MKKRVKLTCSCCKRVQTLSFDPWNVPEKCSHHLCKVCDGFYGIWQSKSPANVYVEPGFLKSHQARLARATSKSTTKKV